MSFHAFAIYISFSATWLFVVWLNFSDKLGCLLFITTILCISDSPPFPVSAHTGRNRHSEEVRNESCPPQAPPCSALPHRELRSTFQSYLYLIHNALFIKHNWAWLTPWEDRLYILWIQIHHVTCVAISSSSLLSAFSLSVLSFDKKLLILLKLDLLIYYK